MHTSSLIFVGVSLLLLDSIQGIERAAPTRSALLQRRARLREQRDRDEESTAIKRSLMGHNDYYGSSAPYSFKYKIEDSYYGTQFGHRETSDGHGRVKGKYYVLLPDGRLQTVTYTADAVNGYKAVVEYDGEAMPSPPPAASKYHTPGHKIATPLASLTSRPVPVYISNSKNRYEPRPNYYPSGHGGTTYRDRGYLPGKRRRRRVKKVKKNNARVENTKAEEDKNTAEPME